MDNSNHTANQCCKSELRISKKHYSIYSSAAVDLFMKVGQFTGLVFVEKIGYLATKKLALDDVPVIVSSTDLP
jgi:hypothetical protein